MIKPNSEEIIRHLHEAEGLSRAHAAQVARELAAARAAAHAAALRAAREAAARIARAAEKAAAVVSGSRSTAGKAVCKASGIRSVVSCVANPSLASCVQAFASLNASPGARAFYDQQRARDANIMAPCAGSGTGSSAS